MLLAYAYFMDFKLFQIDVKSAFVNGFIIEEVCVEQPLRFNVGARMLVSPLTERHLYSWRRIGVLVGADHKAVQRWHGQGIDMLVAALGALARAGTRAGDGGAGRDQPGVRARWTA